MDRLEKKLDIHNPDWLMSANEKLCLIGLLNLLKPKNSIEFGFHKGGATHWLAELAESVITVDVNQAVIEAQNRYCNVTSWNFPTSEAIERIRKEKRFFDFAIIDADHSRNAVARDLQGILPFADLIMLHDSSNPDCRRGMLDILENQDSHAYNLDLINSSIKHDGLWGGIGVAFRSKKGGWMKEFEKEFSPYNYLLAHHSFQLNKKFYSTISKFSRSTRKVLDFLRIKLGNLSNKL